MPLDKWGRDYDQLLKLQAEQLDAWCKLLLPQVHGELVEYCRGINRAVLPDDLAAFASLRVYKAGGLHVCPTGFELSSILLDRSAFEESNQHMLRSTSAVVNAEVARKRNHTMSNIKKQFAIIAAAFAVLADEFTGSAAAAPADPKAALEAVAARKDAKLVKKILSKFGADTVAELEDAEVGKAAEKIEALDDTGDAPAADGGKVTMDVLKALAQELITDGKADALKKIVTKHGAKKVSELAEKEFEAVHAKFIALKD